MSGERARFVADVMLGRLARWLRIMGYDVLYDNVASDPELKRVAAADDRILLTRDREIAETRLPVTVFLVEHDDVQSQIRQVARAFGLDAERDLFTRCIVCNAGLESVGREDVQGLVPSYVLETAGTFARCPDCGKIYWPATHVARARRWLRETLSQEDG
ncbi:MAG: hypothetical protein GF405_09795 [Candidatus Eisenbacteria bacterium]|nr:hypothetical protein [Candidatus Eisenbacteria bacterium]